MNQQVSISLEAAQPPRAVGTIELSSKTHDRQSSLDRFRTSGASKVAFPLSAGAVEAIVLNTSGGLTGGDRFTANFSAGDGSQLVLTTQAAERAYRSFSGTARVTTRLTVQPSATLHWLPQELIFFDGASLDRQLDVALDDTSEAVIAESVVFGRHAMGETRVSGSYKDTIAISLNGKPLYRDRFLLSGDLSAQLQRPAIANGATAMAIAIYYGSAAEAMLPRVRDALPKTGGVSLVAPNLLIVRLVAEDSFVLRQTLVPILEHLTKNSLPKPWSL